MLCILNAYQYISAAQKKSSHKRISAPALDSKAPKPLELEIDDFVTIDQPAQSSDSDPETIDIPTDAELQAHESAANYKSSAQRFSIASMLNPHAQLFEKLRTQSIDCKAEKKVIDRAIHDLTTPSNIPTLCTLIELLHANNAYIPDTDTMAQAYKAIYQYQIAVELEAKEKNKKALDEQLKSLRLLHSKINGLLVSFEHETVEKETSRKEIELNHIKKIQRLKCARMQANQLNPHFHESEQNPFLKEGYDSDQDRSKTYDEEYIQKKISSRANPSNASLDALHQQITTLQKHLSQQLSEKATPF